MSQTRRLALGLDSSTQSLTAFIIDIDSKQTVAEKSVSYRNDARLQGFGIDFETMIVPARESGEADQPPRLFLASLDAIFADLRQQGIDLSQIVSVNSSGQQHGHVYLNKASLKAFEALKSDLPQGKNLADLFANAFSYGTAPIWKTSNTSSQADELRQAVGGKEAMIKLSGSDSPLRFTGAVIRRVGQQFPKLYQETEKILLISDFVPAVLAGTADVAWDYGNAAGTSLMDYHAQSYSQTLIDACAKDLPGGSKALQAKLPALAHPLQIVGTLAKYFVQNYGFSVDCKVVVGSGDNPQTKVLIDGALLSLGTSFVMMASTQGAVDLSGSANAMYDGLGRPFCFGCRTNGALVWDRIRTQYGLSLTDFAACDQALATVKPGTALRVWQPDTESFPLSPALELSRNDNLPIDFAHDYAGLVDSALALVRHFSASFAPQTKTLYLSGGPSANKYIVQRVADIWNCPVVVIGRAGAALGTAVAAGAAVIEADKRQAWIAEACAAILDGAKPVLPNPETALFYQEDYLAKLVKHFQTLVTNQSLAIGKSGD